MADLSSRNVILETEKVRLRPLESGDLEAYVQFAETEA
jgi:hypothetical protein